MSVNQQLSQPAQGLVNLDQYYPNVSLLLHMDGSNGSTTFTDSSIYPKTITVNANAQISTAQSKFGSSSGSFDGVDDYIATPSIVDFGWGSGDVTIECWVRFNNVGSNTQYFLATSTSPYFWMGCYSSGAGVGAANRIFCYWLGTEIRDDTDAVANTWYHVAVSRSGSNTRFFVNGVQKGAIVIGATATQAIQQFYIGGAPGITANNNFLNGYLDDVRFTKGVGRYTTNFNPPDAPFPDNSYSKFYSDPNYTNTALLMHFDGPNGGTNLVDNSINPKTVVLGGGINISTVNSKFGGASIPFNGSSYFFSLPSSSDFNMSTGDFTLEMWVSGDPVSGCLFSNSSFTYFYNNQLWINNSLLISGMALDQTSAWKHIAVVRASGVITVYQNGVARGSGSSSASLDFSSLNFGRYVPNNGLFLIGYIDDLRITKGVARYINNFTAPTSAFPNLPPQTNWIDNIYADQWYGNTVLLLHCDGAGGGTTFRDSSPQVNTVTANGNAITSTAATKWGPTSAAFDGTNSFLSLTYSSAFQFGSGNFTIEMWVYPSSTPNGSALYAETYTGTGDEVSLAIGFCNGTLGSIVGSLPFIGFFSGGAWTGAAASSALTNGVWSFLAYVRNGSTHTLYVNGTSVASFTYAGALPTDADGLIIGRRWDTDQPGNSPYFPGYIDDLRITKGVARYTAAFTPPAAPFPNLAPPGYDPFYQRTSLLLHMDGANGGTTFTDNSPVPKTVTPVGNAVTSTSVVKYGSASAAFDGNGDYLSTPSNTAYHFANGDFTIESWVYLTGYATNNDGFFKSTIAAYDIENSRSWDFNIAGTASSFTQIEFTGFSSNTTFSSVVANYTFSLNTWYHVTCVRSGNTVYLFVNGVLINSGSFSLNMQNSTSALKIGSIDWAPLYKYYLNGYIDDLRITKGVARYTANFQPPTGPFPNR